MDGVQEEPSGESMVELFVRLYVAWSDDVSPLNQGMLIHSICSNQDALPSMT